MNQSTVEITLPPNASAVGAARFIEALAHKLRAFPQADFQSRYGDSVLRALEILKVQPYAALSDHMGPVADKSRDEVLVMPPRAPVQYPADEDFIPVSASYEEPPAYRVEDLRELKNRRAGSTRGEALVYLAGHFPFSEAQLPLAVQKFHSLLMDTGMTQGPVGSQGEAVLGAYQAIYDRAKGRKVAETTYGEFAPRDKTGGFEGVRCDNGVIM